MKIALTKKQWERISDILGNFSILTAGSMVIPALQREFSFQLGLIGIVATVFFWYTSLIAARRY